MNFGAVRIAQSAGCLKSISNTENNNVVYKTKEEKNTFRFLKKIEWAGRREKRNQIRGEKRKKNFLGKNEKAKEK